MNKNPFPFKVEVGDSQLYGFFPSEPGERISCEQRFIPYRELLAGNADKMKDIAANVLNLDPSGALVRISAMSAEGRAAALYWQQIKALLPADVSFPKRVTRDATDPVNRCLNYVYGLLYSEVWRAVLKAGLDPYCGIIHGAKRDQGSLVFDLIEEFRAPFADRQVVALLGHGFKPGIGKDRLLRKKTRKILTRGFLKRWFKKTRWRSISVSPAQILERQARSLADLFNGKGSYRPYRMRW